MASQKKKEKTTKIKKKNWYQIIAPKMFRNAVLGETLLTESKLAMQKPITQNLMSLTNDMKKQNISIRFVIDKVENNKAHASVIGYKMVPSSIRRLTRRRSDKIELSFVCFTSDKKRIRIKPLVFTRGSTKGSITTSLNKATKEYLVKAISKLSFDTLVNDLINGKLQSSLRNAIKKVYPLRNVQIKYMQIEKGKRPAEEVKVEEPVVEEKEEAAEEEETEEITEEAKEEESAAQEPKKEESKKESKE